MMMRLFEPSLTVIMILMILCLQPGVIHARDIHVLPESEDDTVEAEEEVSPQSGTLRRKPTSPAYPEEGQMQVTPKSGTLVKRPVTPAETVLFINPELSFGGLFSNYRKMGHFNIISFGGGVGFTYLENWHFRLNLWASGQTHKHTWTDRAPTTGAPVKYEQLVETWFIQPAIYAMYNLARFPDYHYWLPMDLFLGVKLGINIFEAERAFGFGMDDQVNVLWGFSLHPRFYMWKRLGISPNVEISTIDYFRNFFLHYGVTIFMDFDVVDKKGERVDPLAEEE